MAMNTKMKSAIALSSLTAALLTFSGCGADDETAAVISQTACELAGVSTVLSGAQSADVTVAADGVIGINGEVAFAAGTIFTLGEGATVVGCTGASYVAMDRGSKIEAVGTESNPVVMTSLEGFNGLNTGDEQGQWGGLSIFGSATTNKGIETYEAGDHEFGCDTALGVTCNDADNSGTLQYVAIRYSGYEVETDKELNGLSLGGVGSGTTIDHVAVIGSLDDGIEVWGGTVEMTDIYLYNNADDSLDWDHGWTGAATNVYVEQKEVDGTGSRGFETDNNGGSTTKEQATPISNPTISNFTIVTVAAGGQGIVNREGTAGNLSNGIVITNNATKANVEVRSAQTLTQGLVYTNMVLAQSAGIHFAGKTENTSDSIFGDTTATEVEDLFNPTVIKETGTSLTLLKQANPTFGTDVTAMPSWTK